MLREFTVLNPVESINQRIRLPDMDKINISAPSTRRKGTFMECTRIIQPTSIENVLRKNIRIEKPKKRIGPREQDMVKTQLEIAEIKILTLSLHMQSALCTDCETSQADTTKIIGLYNHSN